MNQHSPGPWRIYEREPDFAAEIESTSKIDVARVYWQSQEEGEVHLSTDPEARDNARLIAAAPQLLSALRYIEEFCDQPMSREQMQTLGKRARIAIGIADTGVPATT